MLNALPASAVTESAAQLSRSGGLPAVGEHHFTAAGVPTWELSGEDGAPLLYGEGAGDIAAPAGADAGPQGYGAVDWKALTGAAGSVGVREVYRVETAGGKAPASCGGSGAEVLVQYAAMYWFYD